MLECFISCISVSFVSLLWLTSVGPVAEPASVCKISYMCNSQATQHDYEPVISKYLLLYTVHPAVMLSAQTVG